MEEPSGTDLRPVGLDLAVPRGGGDGQTDTVVVNATSGDAAIVVSGGGGAVTIMGRTVEMTILAFDAGGRAMPGTG